MFAKVRKYTSVGPFILATVILLSGCMSMPAAPAASPVGDDAAAEEPASESSVHRSDRTSTGRAAESAAPGPRRTRQDEPVTAGVVDDNEQWGEYLDYRQRHRYVYANDVDVSERYVIHVWDEESRPVHDAQVEVYVDERVAFTGRTDAGGQVLFHPRAVPGLDSGQRRVHEFRVVAGKGWVGQSKTFSRSHDRIWALTLKSPPRGDRTQLDLLFLIDATGSMGDEIAKLKASMADVADQIGHLPEQPDVRYGLVAYRDLEDAFVVRDFDFTSNLDKFQQHLSGLRANGGGDTPESLNEALNVTIHDLDWRNDDTVRMVLLVADAPPHLDYHWQPFSYELDMLEAVARGIKIMPIGASGLEEDGEYIFRQLAQVTGGKFVFLTYEEGDDPGSGAGTETSRDVENYSVDTLDRLVVRLVREELAKLATVASGPVQQNHVVEQPKPTPRPIQPVSCTINLDRDRDDCGQIAAIEKIAPLNDGRVLLRLDLDPDRSGYVRARFDVTYGDQPREWTLDIGDSVSNNGYAGDGGQQSNDAEVQIHAGTLSVFGNDTMASQHAADGHRLLFSIEDAVHAGETISLDVSDGRLAVDYAGGIEVFESPYLFALAGQTDREGETNYDLYAAFNRVIGDSGRSGSGIDGVTITLYPQR